MGYYYYFDSKVIWQQCRDWNMGGCHYPLQEQNATLPKPNAATRKSYTDERI